MNEVGCQQFCRNWQSMEIVVHCKNFPSVRLPKEKEPLQQAQVRIPNLGVRCKK